MAAENNTARRMLGDYTKPTSKFDGRSISIPAIGANNFSFSDATELQVSWTFIRRSFLVLN